MRARWPSPRWPVGCVGVAADGRLRGSGVTPPTGRPVLAGHGSIVLLEQACTSCMVCARECPSWCITIDSHQEPVAGGGTEGGGAGTGAGRGRVRTENVLDRFAIDWSLCMYCGICVEECPFDALAWSADLASPEETLGALVAEKSDLAPSAE